jgi:hypothetical protein
MTNTSTMHDYARMGAAARLIEIAAEVAAIQGAFPELGGQRRKRRGRRPKPQPAASGPQTEAPTPAGRKPKRRRTSAAARKAISQAQKKRWAALRAKVS